MRINFFVALAMLLVASCDHSAKKKIEQPTTVEEFLGPLALEILHNPTKVEPFRVVGEHSRKERTSDTKKLDGYDLLLTGPARDEVFARRVAVVFLDSNTYAFDSAKGCIFDPGVVFRVFKGDAYIDLILCFHCREFRLIVFDDRGEKTYEAWEDFDNSEGALAQLAQEAFPEDAEIQKMK